MDKYTYADAMRKVARQGCLIDETLQVIYVPPQIIAGNGTWGALDYIRKVHHFVVTRSESKWKGFHK